jgi:hypothetical protein
MKTRRCTGLLVAFVTVAAAAIFIPAHADPVLTLDVGPLMEPMRIQNQDRNGLGEGNYGFKGTNSMSGMWELTYNVTANEDPYINAQFGFQNLSSMTQQFILASSIPISPDVVPSSLIGGSFGGSLTDANGSGGATLSTANGNPLYYGQIDGSGVLPIYSDPYSLSASSFAGQTVNIPAVNSGLPGPSISGPAATNSIGITHIFSLTPGDSVSFTSYFVVEPIPEPATLGLIALFSGSIYFARRFFNS